MLAHRHVNGVVYNFDIYLQNELSSNRKAFILRAKILL